MKIFSAFSCLFQKLRDARYLQGDNPYSIENTTNCSPWEVTFDTRLKEFLSDANGQKTVIYVADAPNTSTFRYRVYNIRQCLAGSNIRVCYFYRFELREIELHLKRCDLLVFERAKWTVSIQNAIDRAKSQGIPLAYDVDDMICSLEALQPVAHALNLNLEDEKTCAFWTSWVARGEMVARQCDAYLVTNRYLGNWLSQTFGGKPSYVIENGLNQEQIDVSKRIVQQKEKKATLTDKFIIGYFSGTKSHIEDFKVLAPELLRFLHDYPSAQLVVVGFMEFPAEMRELIDAGRIVTRPLVNFLQLQAEMAAVDVNVVPLINTPFTNCKSELKYFEAAIVDTLTIASPTYAYSHSIRHGETGFLCQEGEWYPTLVRLINRECDVSGMVSMAHRECIARYSGTAYAHRAAEVLKSLMTRNEHKTITSKA